MIIQGDQLIRDPADQLKLTAAVKFVDKTDVFTKQDQTVLNDGHLNSLDWQIDSRSTYEPYSSFIGRVPIYKHVAF